MPFSFIHALKAITELLTLPISSIFTPADRPIESNLPPATDIPPTTAIPPAERSSNVISFYEDLSLPWVPCWAKAIVADPVSPESVTSRLQDLLARKSVDGISSFPTTIKPERMLCAFIIQAQWDFKPAAIDAVWHAIFSIAEARGWTEDVRYWTYEYSMEGLLQPPCDTRSDDDEDDDEEDAAGDEYDNEWISCTLAEARLLALGYGYSILAWDALFAGLGLGEDWLRVSDSLRIGSCAQLLGAGTRLRLLMTGGGNEHQTPGPAGDLLGAKPKYERAEYEKNGADLWRRILDALVEEQSNAGPKAAALMQLTHKHLASNIGDLDSAEVASIVWPEMGA